MGSRAKRMARCNGCRMHLERCICGQMPHFDLATRLVLVMHRHEVSKTTATGPLALAVLANSELRVHGYQERPLDLADLQQPERRLLILYPGEDAPLLSRSFLEEDLRPVTLVVPDGNWRQASRMGRRLPGVEQAEMVRLPAAAATEWGVRREPHPEGLATFEAIARAMGILESVEVQQRMEGLFRLMVQETLQARGGRKELL